MSNKVYDVLKWIVMILLPATAVFYELLAGTWGLPYADQICTTLTGFAAFLGSILMISTAKYNKKKTGV